MNILAIIPARKDSIRCPRKNIRLLDGIYLYWHTFVKVYEFIDEFKNICITTNDNKILKEVCVDIGVDLIKRPDSLCINKSTEFEFVEHVLNFYKEMGIYFDDVAIFYPTTPFKKVETIKKILKQWQKDRQWHNQLRTVKEIKWEPEKIWYESYSSSIYSNLRDIDDFSKYYKQVPYCYIYKINKLNKQDHYFYQSVSKFVINDPIESHDINTEFDFKIAELIVKEGLNE